MNLALVGPGAIGSTLAFQLSRAGHDVTVVARGQRLERLTRDGAIVRVDGEHAKVTVQPVLDTSVAYDLVLVTVLATQVEAVLPALRASAAKKVMFLFNTFDDLAPLRDAVGAGRFSFGFPGGIFCLLLDGKIRPAIRSGTTVGDAEVAKLFEAAGIPTVVEPDMQSWLRTHAAMVAPLMSIGVLAFTQQRGASWAEAKEHALAFRAGFDLVRRVGNQWRPGALGTISRLPLVTLAFLLWAMSRSTMIRELGQLGATEPRMLIDMMNRAKPELGAPLLAIRP
ncbi:MAG: ketopantoate reductase family protein [Archangium sp.]